MPWCSPLGLYYVLLCSPTVIGQVVLTINRFPLKFQTTIKYYQIYTEVYLVLNMRGSRGGPRGPWPPPPSPQNIAPPNSEARAKRALAPPPGAKGALAPPLTKSWIRLCWRCRCPGSSGTPTQKPTAIYKLGVNIQTGPATHSGAPKNAMQRMSNDLDRFERSVFKTKPLLFTAPFMCFFFYNDISLHC